MSASPKVRIMFRLIWCIFWLVFFFFPIALISIIPPRTRRPFNLFIYRSLARLFRIKITVKGQISHKDPVLFVSNHMSYADILVLGAVLPGNFISKAEVKKWPLFGWIAVLTGTVFISRKKAGTLNQLNEVERAIDTGKNLIIFPEGTTSDGKGVMPFKSSLFKITESRDMTVQPVTLSYTHINGLPLQANERVKIAWVGDSELIPHLKEFINLGIIRAEVKLHEPLTIKGDRKLIAEESHKIVADWKS